MKKFISLFCCMILILGLVACSGTPATEEQEPANTQEQTKHKIGVLVYSLQADEVLCFKDYLENYIERCYEDVDFVYSDSILSAEDAMAFIQDAADAGVEGILSFNFYDLKAEVELCEKNGMYYLIASGTANPEAFKEVQSNPYFLGEIGPGSDLEYEAGRSLAQAMMEEAQEKSFFILSGGSAFGNQMHLQRTKGMITAIAEQYGVTFPVPVEEMAPVAEPTIFEADGVTICVAPGYVDIEDHKKPVAEALEQGSYANVLSTIPANAVLENIQNARLGIVDCFSEGNGELFRTGQLNYVIGKYRSIIGPSFMVMYNAINGKNEQFRNNGNAIDLVQGFWTAKSPEEYEKMFALSASIEMNAYNYEDLDCVNAMIHPEAGYEELKALVEAYDYESAASRRNIED